MRIPCQFVDRLGWVGEAEFEMDTIKNLNKGSQEFTEAKQYAWGTVESSIPANMISVMAQRVQPGIQVKMLISHERLPTGPSLPEMPRNVEFIGLSNLPALGNLTEICWHLPFFKLEEEWITLASSRMTRSSIIGSKTCS